MLALWEDVEEWTQDTFGTDEERGPLGPIKHLQKEAYEVEVKPTDWYEYADCLILIFDAARRAGMKPYDLLIISQAKMQTNKLRTYPKPGPDEVSEHTRD